MSAWPLALPAQAPLFADDFAGDRLDTNRWQLTLPFSNPPPSTARLTNGTVELFRRAILEARPAMPAALDIEGQLRFVGDADTLSVVFRSDLSVTSQEERRGVQAALQQGTGRVVLIPEPFTNAPIVGTYLMGRDTNIAFRVTDNGHTVRLFVQDFFQPILTVGITNQRGQRLAVYNLNGTASRTRLDHFAVYPLQTSIFLDETLVRTTSVRRSTPTRVRFQSIFTNSVVFYSLDGSEPSFVSTEYTGPFSLSNSATLRAVAYTADFLSSSYSGAVDFQYRPIVRLTNETRGGGTVTFDPAGPYFSNQVVGVTALAAPGWQFVRWEGAASGTSLSNQVSLTNHLAVRAVFATTPAFTVIGGGQLQTLPAGPPFEYGTSVRLVALPNAGQYFVRWGNSVTGLVSPAALIVTNASPGVTALFAPLTATQLSLTVQLEGSGTVAVAPPANVFTNGQSVTLTARPDANHIFLGWSGSATGATNPLNLVLTNSRTVLARFAPSVRFDPTTLQYGSNGFRLSVTGRLRPELELQSSSNLTDWITIARPDSTNAPWPYQHLDTSRPPRLFYRVMGP